MKTLSSQAASVALILALSMLGAAPALAASDCADGHAASPNQTSNASTDSQSEWFRMYGGS